jgi:hypothetical protein
MYFSNLLRCPTLEKAMGRSRDYYTWVARKISAMALRWGRRCAVFQVHILNQDLKKNPRVVADELRCIDSLILETIPVLLVH